MADQTLPIAGTLDVTPRERSQAMLLEWLHGWVVTVDHKRLGILYVVYAIFFLLVAGAERSRETALSIFQHLHERLAPFKRIRRIELVTELPKTISGKIRRVQLRRLEHDNDRADSLRGQEFREEDFPELQKLRPAGSTENS